MSNRGKIKGARALQISNNVSEEYIDQGDTSFATKAELCETLIWFRNRFDAELRRKDSALDDIATAAVKARIYPK